MNCGMNLRIVNHRANIVRNRDLAKFEITTLFDVSNHNSPKTDGAARSLSQQIGGRLKNPHNSTTYGTAADKCNVQFWAGGHQSSLAGILRSIRNSLTAALKYGSINGDRHCTHQREPGGASEQNRID